MQSFEDFMDLLSCFSGVDVLCYGWGRFFDYRKYINFNPVRENVKFREELIRAADEQDVPLIIIDSHDVVFACIRQDVGREEDAYFTLGPISLKYQSKIELHYYYRDYGLKNGTENPLPVLHFTKILELVELAAGILTEVRYTHKQLIKGNYLDARLDQILEESQKKFSASFHAELPHHTYEEERRILDAMREGRAADAVELSMVMDSRLGAMSKKDNLQWQKTAIVGIALCTRAAIEGGLSPAEAYRISDFYNQKCDECKSVSELVSLRNLAVNDLAEHVRRKRESGLRTDYVEICCDYINKHYREKIHLEDIADRLGLNPSYLSRVFSHEMGIKMQDYIVKERVERAANMLTFSDLEISEIGDYVGFPSQSYFGKMFKKYMQATPKQYRNLHRPKEFVEDNSDK